MQSCIYEGQVSHSRTRPVLHRFRYRMFMMYLDLDELPVLFKSYWCWSANRFALARFRRRDHLGPADQPLAESVRDIVEARTGNRPGGPIRLLTHMSYFGYCFNPVSFYYCFSDDGHTLETIVTEVNNTPWGERDTYVLPASENIGKQNAWRFQPAKKMHVSPFMAMDIDYDWTFTEPADRASVHMTTLKDGRRFFTAAMTMRRTEIGALSLARVLITFPFMTLKVTTAIYWQALRLWVKRCPLYIHPRKKDDVAVQQP